GLTGVSQHLLALLFVSSFHTYYQRHIEVNRFAGSYHPSGDNVTTHNAAKNINQNSYDIFITKHDFKCLSHFFGTRPPTYIKKVSGFATKQLNRVHGSHGQTGTIH